MARKTVYIDVNESSEEVKALLISILLFVDVWVHKQRTAVPRAEIFKKMRKKGKSEEQIDHALRLLIRLHYLRKGVSMSNKTTFVQLRTDRPK